MSVTESQSDERVAEGRTRPKVFAEHQARYAFVAPGVVGKRVLDVACGTGYGSRMLSEAGAAAVVGVDCDAATIAYARARYGNPRVTFVQGDACSLPLDGHFDVIASFETIEHLADPEGFLSGCLRLLAPRGRLYVSTPYRRRTRTDGSPVNPFHVREWRTDEFAELLRRCSFRATLYGQAVKLGYGRRRISRSLAWPLAVLRGVRLHDPEYIYPLPAPTFFGLWDPQPGYILAVCEKAAVPEGAANGGR